MDGSVAMGWDPVAAAVAAGVEVRTDAIADLLGGGLACSWRGVDVVVLSPRLSGADRVVALAHELVHLERGGGIDEPSMPTTWAAEVAREERAVDDEVARRLVPVDALAAAADAGATTVTEAAAWLGLPVAVVDRSLRLARASRAGGPADPRWRGR